MIRRVSALRKLAPNDPNNACFFCRQFWVTRQSSPQNTNFSIQRPFLRWLSPNFYSEMWIQKHYMPCAISRSPLCTKSDANTDVISDAIKAPKMKKTKVNRRMAQNKRSTVSKLAKIHFDNPALEIFDGMKYADVLESKHPHAEKLFNCMPRQMQRLFLKSGLPLAKLEQMLPKADIRFQIVSKLSPPEPYQLHPEEIPLDMNSCASPVVRPAVITILGHVDHGKTTLLDYMRKSNIVDGESGGITQRIGAFTLKLPEKDTTVTFIDTPGHAAFDRMRERGTQCTDLVILIVAADDGVMTQTVECIDFIKKYNTPYIVVITKIDKSNAMVETIEEQLVDFGIDIEKHGGSIPCVPISIHNNQTLNISELIETIDCQSELLQPLCDPKARTEGIVIEANTDPLSNEKVASIIVKQGTLKTGQCLVCGDTTLKVKKIGDENGQKLEVVTPGKAANVFGWKNLPQPGDYAMEVSSEKIAKEIMERRLDYNQAVRGYEAALQARDASKRERDAYVQSRLSSNMHFAQFKLASRKQHFDNLKKAASVETVPAFNLFLRADNQGSLEAIMHVLDTFETKYCTLNVLNQGVGVLSETELELAKSLQNSIVMYFNLDETHIQHKSLSTDDSQTRDFEEDQILLISEKVIYQLISQFKEIIEQNIDQEPNDVIIGEAVVKEIFKVSSSKSIVGGCKVLKGRLERKSLFKLLRNEQEVVTGRKVTSLKQVKNDVMLVESGKDCGLVLENYDDIQKGDVIQCYEVEMRTPSIEWDPKF